MSFILRNTTGSNILIQDSYLSQPFAEHELIDLETIWTFEQLHKSTYYQDGAIRSALLAGDLELVDPSSGYRDPIWRGSSPRIEYITLTQTHIDEKKVNLREVPNKNLIAVDILGGISQFPDTDFVVSHQELSWNALGLDGLLESGDTMRIIYGS